MSARYRLVNGFAKLNKLGFEGYPDQWRPYLWGSKGSGIPWPL